MATVAPIKNDCWRMTDWSAIREELSDRWQPLNTAESRRRAFVSFAFTFRERVFDARRMLEARLRTRFGNRLIGADVYSFRYGEPDDDAIDVSVLQFTIRNGTPEECADATEILTDCVFDNFENDIRRGILIEIVGRHG